MKRLASKAGGQRVMRATTALRLPGESKYRPHQGAGEQERRRRQIERGQLTRSNGLAE